MTVIAWDGKELVSDKQATNNGLKMTVTKIRKSRGHLLFGSGNLDVLLNLYDWFERGAKAEEWPECQKDKDGTGYLMAITPEGKILRWEKTPYPFLIEDQTIATGSGRDYAMAALRLGYSAQAAVTIASQLDTDCGMGMDILTL